MNRGTTTDFSTLEKALSQLESALQSPPKNDLERDGAIHRFEYTFELTWKVAKQVLAHLGVEAASPKAVIRELGTQGIISDVEAWFKLLKARNASTHTDVETTAQDVFKSAQAYPAYCRTLISELKKQ